MKLPCLFRPKWRHADSRVRLSAMAKIHDPKLLYRIATCSQDERLCLEAAHRLNDPTLLARLARNATSLDIRFEAALLIRDESTLVAIALEAWHITKGEMAVIHIDTALLLRRLARSANQDAIRLAAALKLNDISLLHQVVQSTNDIQIRWQVALHLDDPQLLAEVAIFKQNDFRLADLRRKARGAFKDYLNRRHGHMDVATIINIIKTVTHSSFKVDAFLKLPPHKITMELLSHLSRQDFQPVSHRSIQRMLEKIRCSDWIVQKNSQAVTCRQCNGTGKYAFKSMVAESSYLAHDILTCTECDGVGHKLIDIATCKHPHFSDVRFHLPLKEPAGFHTRTTVNDEITGDDSH